MNKSLTKKMFEKEAGHLTNLLNRFQSSGGNPSGWEACLDTEVPYLIIYNFTLPEKFEPKDQEDIVISLANYPDSPPNGIYIQKTSTRNLSLIKESLKGHIYDKTYNTEDEIKTLEKNWDWICFHMKDNKWKYNFEEPLKGDCLYGYLLLLFSALDGKYTQ